MDIWHDRAVFHFLTTTAQRTGYLDHLRRTLKRNVSAIIATFALDGPTECSGIPVVRYAPEILASELGDGFTLVDSARHVHVTPWGTEQPFQYSHLLRVH